jgi:hypothetical protein
MNDSSKTVSDIEVSIVMPCLNEADTLETCIKKAQTAMSAESIGGEIIVADNGSTDESIEIARRNGAVVVNVSEKGYGSALMGGIAAARGKFVIMGDADDSYDFLETPKFVKKLREGYDLVQGCRLPAGGGTLHVDAVAESVVKFDALEVVVNGQVIAAESAVVAGPDGTYCCRLAAPVALVATAVAGCRADMHDTPRADPLRQGAFFKDASSARPTVEGTIARGTLQDDAEFFTGKNGALPSASRSGLRGSRGSSLRSTVVGAFARVAGSSAYATMASIGSKRFVLKS